MSDDTAERVVAVNRGAERSDRAASSRGEAHRALDAWIGRWINQGYMIDEHGIAGLPITTSDVYEWAPGGFFVVHTAYGRIGDLGVGGVEIIGYDAASNTPSDSCPPRALTLVDLTGQLSNPQPALEALVDQDIGTPQDASPQKAQPSDQVPRRHPRTSRPLKAAQIDVLNSA